MQEHVLFVTGKLAEKSLRRVLESIRPTPFTWEVRQLGVSVAALMTTEMIGRRLDALAGVDRLIIPGRCRGDIAALSMQIGIPTERGPEELKDLPAYFGKAGRPIDLSRFDIRIFAEIVDAPEREVDAIVSRAEYYRRNGADVIDLGCLPSTPFPHLELAVHALKERGFQVSVDSLRTDDLLRGARAGADYLLSLNEDTLWVAAEVDATPILIPRAPGDLNSLFRAIEACVSNNRACLADPVLDPIHAGFTASLLRYHAVRERYPEVEILMGIGNLTELTHADSAGVNTVMLGIMSELGIRNLLTTEVSPHCRCAIREADLARRIVYAARAEESPPRHIDDGLMALHERKPFPFSPQEIDELAAAVKDRNYRIHASDQGIHLFNRDGIHLGDDPYALYPSIDVAGDVGHAFYLGVELARAQIAVQLGKRYTQDEPLSWGCAVERAAEDITQLKPLGPTLHTRKHSSKPV
ncbi:MAG: DUF6513 domain-containing protein [Thiotrichales bacterium]